MSPLTNPGVVHLVVPDGIDDPTRPSGGNVYDRRVADLLPSAGWAVCEHPVSGSFADLLVLLPDDVLVLVDGLVAVHEPRPLLRESRRLRVVVLLHMPFGERDAGVGANEALVLGSAQAVVTTSEWSRRWVLDRYALPVARTHVAEPGVDRADLATGSRSGGELLCVAAATQDKGHAVLLAALAQVADRPWRLTCVGSLDRDPVLVDRLHRHARELGIADRVTWTGALTGDDLEKAYAGADALVLASRAESWGMVVGEALARGLPVLATEVGGLPEALGVSEAGLPGVLVPADDADSLAGEVRRWFEDDLHRARLRQAARARRTTLTGWSLTAAKVGVALAEAAR